MKNRKIIIPILLSAIIMSACTGNASTKDIAKIGNTVNDHKIESSKDSQLTEQQLVFNEFWNLYDRYYPSFNRKGIDWQKIYDTYYPLVSNNTSDEDLFKIFEEIIILIDDGHTSLTYKDREAVSEDNSIPEIMETFENVTPTLVNIVESSKDNQLISYGKLKNNPKIGYINSKVFMPMTEDGEENEENFEKEMKKFENTIEEALIYLKDTDGIIIDVRGNGGGDGGLATHLAGRFFKNSPVEYSRKRIKIAAGSKESAFGEWVTKEFDGIKDKRSMEGTMASVGPEFNTIGATGSFQYTKPVVVLTSWTTASSGEYFTVAMKTQPHVTTVGNRTCGIFSGSENVILSNGNGKWTTNISVQDTEFMFNGKFQGLEGKGITPDYLLIPTKEDIENNKDIHIEKALEIIYSH
ncbi:MAG: S41 family peptidase [Firmicutes bacterium]|jgi:hypothetical protein|nr:S41 family peptidase [Bacillota bacterium]